MDNQSKNIEAILKSYREIGGINHLDGEHMPSRQSVDAILVKLRSLLFPGFFEAVKVNSHSLPYITGQKVIEVASSLQEEILKSLCWDCRESKKCVDKSVCLTKSQDIVSAFMAYIPELRKSLKEDATANFQGDPAATSVSEVILAYPGFQAITVYRIAHFLAMREVPLIPRLMTEIAHSETGIDIHPQATIGKRFCIDHGTGIVIGGTAVLGDNVKLYQGVTIGALSVSKSIKGRRHPTLEDNVVIYANATILGGKTVVGNSAVIGGSVWLTKSVPPHTTVYLGDGNQLVTKVNKP